MRTLSGAAGDVCGEAAKPIIYDGCMAYQTVWHQGSGCIKGKVRMTLFDCVGWFGLVMTLAGVVVGIRDLIRMYRA